MFRVPRLHVVRSQTSARQAKGKENMHHLCTVCSLGEYQYQPNKVGVNLLQGQAKDICPRSCWWSTVGLLSFLIFHTKSNCMDIFGVDLVLCNICWFRWCVIQSQNTCFFKEEQVHSNILNYFFKWPFFFSLTNRWCFLCKCLFVKFISFYSKPAKYSYFMLMFLNAYDDYSFLGIIQFLTITQNSENNGHTHNPSPLPPSVPPLSWNRSLMAEILQ